jgi:hypothetical protein
VTAQQLTRRRCPAVYGSAFRRPKEWDQFEAFFTPLPVVLQGVGSIASIVPPKFNKDSRFVVLDLGAGSGGFGQVVRDRWPEAEIVAVEARASEAVHLRRHYDRVIIDDATSCRLPSADMVLSNPPFRKSRRLAERAFEVVRPGGIVSFLTRQTWGDADDVEELLRRCPPVAELTISGRVSMGSSGQSTKDQFGYQWLVWQGLRLPGSPWPRLLLPRLDRASLGWTARPGTGHLMDLDDDLVVDLRGVVQ